MWDTIPNIASTDGGRWMSMSLKSSMCSCCWTTTSNLRSCFELDHGHQNQTTKRSAVVFGTRWMWWWRRRRPLMERSARRMSVKKDATTQTKTQQYPQRKPPKKIVKTVNAKEPVQHTHSQERVLQPSRILWCTRTSVQVNPLRSTVAPTAPATHKPTQVPTRVPTPTPTHSVATPTPTRFPTVAPTATPTH